jgi:TPR repeat protein
MYAKGEGVRKDLDEAAQWFLKAAKRNHLPAVELVARGYLAGESGLPLDRGQAEFWGERAVALGGRRPVLAPPPASGRTATREPRK